MPPWGGWSTRSTARRPRRAPAPPQEKKPKKQEKKPKKDEHGNQDKQGHGGDQKSKPGHSVHGGLAPPGQAKLKGEPG